MKSSAWISVTGLVGLLGLVYWLSPRPWNGTVTNQLTEQPPTASLAPPAPEPSVPVPSGEYTLAPDVVVTAWLPPNLNLAGPGGPLRVTDRLGHELLKVEGGVLAVAGTRNVGAPFPVLLVKIWGGGSMGDFFEAYLYDPDQRSLRRLNWDAATFVISRWDVVQAPNGVMTSYRQELSQPDANGRWWKERYALWRYQDGVIRRVEDGDKV